MAAFSLPRMVVRTFTLTLLLSTFAAAQQYTQTNLVSDVDGMAAVTDPNLKNPWGLSRSSGSPWWVANNGTGTSTLYDAKGNPQPAASPLVVSIPPPKDGSNPGKPTGTVFNGTMDFAIAAQAPAVFLFATLDGTISGWNPTIDPHNAKLMVDNSKKQAVYKGLTMAEWRGAHFLYAANFHSGKVEVYDTHFHRVRFSGDAFEDRRIPHGFAPINVQAIGKNIVVAYAKPDAEGREVAGAGLGFVDVFSPAGVLSARLEHGPWFNAPWGLAQAPGEFGEFSHSLLVGNFGSGKIAAFNALTGAFQGLMKNTNHSTLQIEGLWALSFGNNGAAGSATALFFSAGINEGADGLFGSLTPITTELNEEDVP